MNYRHAFHAGNFADVLKHVLLTRILVYLTRKPAPLRYIDTHAGLGWYDLGASEAERTGEWRNGIGRLRPDAAPPGVAALLTPYLDIVGSRDSEGKPHDYPGSPGLAQQLLRPDDRLILCEKHPDDARTLRQAIGRDKRAKVLEIDGYTALKANVPPPERRGLVLIDPPFEDRDEFTVLSGSIATAVRKWATGTYAVWYPIKASAPVADFVSEIRSLEIANLCQFEMLRDGDEATSKLRGCGLLVVNPPYVLRDEAETLLPYLCTTLSDSQAPPFRWRCVDHGNSSTAGTA